MPQTLPSPEILYQALLDKDSRFEGIFVAAVKTTGIFCRPTCRAKKPQARNVEYFNSAQEALLHGYRPCKLCRPLDYQGQPPDWLEPLVKEIDANPGIKLKDYDLKQRGLDPNRVRRWFKTHLGMTFQAYLRGLRIAQAFGNIKHGDKVIEAAFASGYDSLSGFGQSFKKSTGFAPQGSTEGELIRFSRVLTPLGPMMAGATGKGICLLEFTDRRMLETQFKRLKKRLRAELLPGKSPYFEVLQRELQEYFEGTRKEFEVPLELVGTDFQKLVWRTLLEIPHGRTRSYKEQAQAVGRPEAVRAVAKANGDNPISIIVPCHRVIGSNGELTGYGGGLWRKQYLLNLEQAGS
jgi:AraC family transcriptional regulator of adaptative response/methylated-DNA-[protein]-cysteine methyltransferase